MRLRIAVPCAGLALAAIASGCSTFGVSGELEAVIIDTQKRVKKLNDELGGSVEKLNATTTELYTRVEANENTSARLQEVVDNSQQQLDQLAVDLRDFRNTLYRHLNLSVPGMAAPPPPPAAEPAPAPAAAPAADVPAPQPGSMPLPPPTPPAATTYTPASGATAPPVAASAPLPPAGEDPVALYTKAQKTYAAAQDNPGQLNQAISEFDAFLAKFPDTQRLSPNAHFWKGKSYLSLGRYDDAVRSFDDLRAKFPSDDKVPFAMQNQAVAFNNLGQVDKAVELLEKVVAEYPTSPVADQAKLDLQKLKGGPPR